MRYAGMDCGGTATALNSRSKAAAATALLLKAVAAATAVQTLLLLLACTPSVSPTDWQHMSNDEKVVYVGSLMGAEQVKNAKGGGGKRYDDAAEEYVTRIDAAYAHGDAREPAAIFAGMGKP